MQRVLKAIQERKIDRVAAAYGVAAWLLVQAASIGLPTFGAPAWVMKVMIMAALAGFPLVLWITWHVAAPAHGMADEVSASLRRTDMALLGFLAVLILLVGGQFAYQLGAFHPKNQSNVIGASRAPVMQASVKPPATSIAVLPFLNLSGDPKKEFFSDGISEELLNDLANTPKLRVAARTSCFAFKGRNEDIRKIAQALNVRAILEGSVREDGQHIRITAQLINASDGYHLWSKTYDRDLSNILQVQDEIAQAITVALTHTLGGGVATPPKRPAIDPDAYRDYLKAQALSALKTDGGDAQAVSLLKTVTAREPSFAPAFAGLGRTYVHMINFHNRDPDLRAAAKAALDEALAIDPRNLEALSSRLYLYTLGWDWTHAATDAAGLQRINAHNVFTLRGLQFYYGTLGFPEQQSAALQEVIRLDPLSFVDLNNLASAYLDQQRYPEAATAASAALALKPNRPLTLYSLCWASAGMRDIEKARLLSRKLSSIGNSDASFACSLRIALAAGDLSGARKAADEVAQHFPGFFFGETDVGYFYALTNNYSAALRWLQRAYSHRDTTLFSLAYSPTTPPKLIQNFGWKSLMAKPEARAWQRAHDRVAATLARN